MEKGTEVEGLQQEGASKDGALREKGIEMRGLQQEGASKDGPLMEKGTEVRGLQQGGTSKDGPLERRELRWEDCSGKVHRRMAHLGRRELK